MTRTTLDIPAPILDDLRALQKQEGRSLGSIASELLADGLALRRKRTAAEPPTLRWVTRAMGAPRVDLEDKEALHALLDREGPDDYLRVSPPPDGETGSPVRRDRPARRRQ